MAARRRGPWPGPAQEIWNRLKPYLQVRASVQAPKALPKPKGIDLRLHEMVRLGASGRAPGPGGQSRPGRRHRCPPARPGRGGRALALGAGTPGRARADLRQRPKTLPAQQAAQWVEGLLDPRIIKLDGAAFALAQLARLTGDRSRDLEPELRARVLNALRAAPRPAILKTRMVREVVAMEAADRVRALGDTLPVGLAIRDEPERPEGTGTGGCS